MVEIAKPLTGDNVKGYMTASGRVRILYFVPETPASSSGVLHAHVLTPARYLSQNGFDCMFIGARFFLAADYVKNNFNINNEAYQLRELMEKTFGNF